VPRPALTAQVNGPARGGQPRAAVGVALEGELAPGGVRGDHGGG
jgi:hypothetical protein